MKMTGFDAKQAKEVAWVIGTVIGAGAGALLAAAAAAKVMEWANKTIKPGNIKDIYMGGLMLMAILPAVLLLGLVLIGLGALLALVISPKKAEEYAWAVASIMGAAAIVALAVLAAAAAMTVLGLLVPVAEYILPFMLLGALALIILTPAMFLLAGAVLGMAALMTKIVDPEWASGVATATSDIMMSAGKIALAVVLSAGALMILSSMLWWMPIILPLMTAGTLALLILTPAVVGLAFAVIKMAKWISSLAPPDADKTAQATADILMAAAKIALAVVAGAAVLMALSLMVYWAWIIIPLMASGTLALLALTPTVIGMAVAVINMASKLATAANAEAGKKAAENLQSVLESAAKISKAVVDGKAQIESLAPGWSIIFSFGRDTFREGATALYMLTPQVVLLAKAIINMAKKETQGSIVKDGLKAAKNLASVLSSAQKIIEAINKSKKTLESFEDQSFWGWFKKVANDKAMERGSEVLIALTPQVVKVAKAVIGMAQRETVGDIAKKGRKAASDLGSVLQSAQKIITAISKSKEALENFNDQSFWGWFKKVVKGKAMERGGEVLVALTPQVVKIARAVLDMAQRETVGGIAKDGRRAAADLGSVLQSAQKIITAISKSKKALESFEDQSFWGWFRNVVKNKTMERGGEVLVALTPQVVKLAKAVIEMAQETAGGNAAKDGRKAASSLSSLLYSAIRIVRSIMRSKKVLSKMSSDLENSGDFLSETAMGIINHVIAPIKSFPTADEVDAAMEGLLTLDESMGDLLDIMSDLSETLAEMGSVKLDFSALENVGGVFRSGKMEFTIQGTTAGGGGGIFGSLFSGISEGMERLVGVFTGVHSPSVNPNSKYMRAQSKGVGGAVGKPMDSVANATKKVGRGVGRLGGTMNRFTAKTGGLPGRIDAMKNQLHGDLTSILTQLRAGGGGPGGDMQPVIRSVNDLKAALESVGTKVDAVNTTLGTSNSYLKDIRDDTRKFAISMGLVADEGTERGSLYTHDIHMEDLMLNKVLPHVEKLVATAVEAEKEAKTATNNADFDKQVQARVEQSRPSEAMMSSLQYLAAIAANTAATNESVQDAIDVLEDIRERLPNRKDQGGAATGTKSKRRRIQPNYRAWMSGSFGQSAEKQYR